ncbi:hypothetical protein FRC04_001993 [Tulasnella sp. 424]|nr:hypothetical protein FRC04_001993 [Tulasnella sp. 424]KAG8981094.1 hypothetical protein FRC05_003994 [Tulasnella sp. 425]
MTHQPIQYHHPKCRRRRSPTSRRSIVVLGFGLLAIDAATAQSVPSARWGQASTVVGTTLLVQGGKVDPDNSYSYTAAPNTNDLFALDLSHPFNCSDPPWAYLSGSQNPATSQGPAIAFHTLSAYSAKRALTFGGVGGPDIAIETNADSVWTLEFWNQSSVTWTEQPENWGDEPTRREYHSAAVYDKAVWITGGERADGSGLGYSETYMFTGSGSSGQFTNLQAAVAGGVLPDIVGHASVVLPNGLLVTIGGYSPSHQSMIPMTTIFTLDTTRDNAVWGLMVAEGSHIPSTRRNFALAVLPNNTLLIHGGSDASMQTFYSDGFTLNFGTSPPTWSSLPSALSDDIGPRIGHMAVGVGKNVIFGFGRSPNGPAPATLVVYDTVAGTTSDSYQPDSSGSTNPNSTPTTTNGQPTVTGNPSTITDSAGPSTTVSVSVSTCVSTGTVTVVCTPTDTSAADGAGSKKRAIIALSSVLGILGALAVALALIWWFFRRRNPKSSPSASRRSNDRPWTGLLAGYRHGHLVGSGDTEDPVLPGATAREKIPTVGGARYSDPPRGIVGLLAAPFRRSQEFNPQARKDMLGDEDDQELFVPIHGGGHSDETGSAVRPTFKRWGTSTKQLLNGMVNASTTSFKAAFGFGGTGTDGPPTPGISLFNRQPDSPDWWEKTNDPFAEDALLMASLPNGPTTMGMEMAATQRQRGGGSGHYQSATFSSTSTGLYRDPFVDPSLGGHSRESTAASLSAPYLQMARTDSYQPFMMPLDDPPPRSSLAPGRPLSPPTIDMSNVRLAPGLITPGTLASSDTLSHGHEFGLTTPGIGTDSSSGERSASPYPRSLLATPPTSIIGSAPTTPMKRSDTWWARFGRASLTSLSRSGSGAGGLNPIRSLRSQIGGGSRSPTDAYASLDFRDPNPPPRLEGIEETGQSNDPSPESVKPKEGSGDSAIGFVARRKLKHPLRDLHSKSQSSMATADSEALEKMGRMDVIQRGRTASSETTTPAGSIYEGWEYGTAHLVPLQHASPVSSFGDRPSPVTHKSSSGTSAFLPTPPSATGSGTQETYLTAKTHQDSGPSNRDGSDSFKSIPSPIPPPPPAPRRGRRPSSGLASRVAVFENMALSTSPPGSPSPLSPTSPRSPRSPSTISQSPLREVDKRKSGGVRYGLMERPPLFVANPDAKSMRSATESTVEGEPLTPPPPSASSPRPLL